MTVSFQVSADELDLIDQIAERARSLDARFNPKEARPLLDWRMDFTATHANGNPLRLADLLAADDFNFAHDAFGIASHLDRATGELTRCFRPRFSAPATAEAA